MNVFNKRLKVSAGCADGVQQNFNQNPILDYRGKSYT